MTPPLLTPDDSATMRTVLTSADYFNLKSSDIGSVVGYYLNGDSANSTDALLAGDVVEILPYERQGDYRCGCPL